MLPCGISQRIMARRKKSIKQRLKGNLGQEPKSFKPGKQHLLCIPLAGFCCEVAVSARGQEQDGAAAIEVGAWPLLATHPLFFSASV